MFITNKKSFKKSIQCIVHKPMHRYLSQILPMCLNVQTYIKSKPFIYKAKESKKHLFVCVYLNF